MKIVPNLFSISLKMSLTCFLNYQISQIRLPLKRRSEYSINEAGCFNKIISNNSCVTVLE